MVKNAFDIELFTSQESEEIESSSKFSESEYGMGILQGKKPLKEMWNSQIRV